MDSSGSPASHAEAPGRQFLDQLQPYDELSSNGSSRSDSITSLSDVETDGDELEEQEQEQEQERQAAVSLSFATGCYSANLLNVCNRLARVNSDF